jgi:hypothetical protein
MGGNGERNVDQLDVYQPVRAVSMTGLFPGFARPHFVPSNELQGASSQTNTLYVQLVAEEQIIAFEPLEEDVDGIVVELDTRDCPVVAPGDAAVYVYAFGPADAVVGSRSIVAQAIEQRFDEIAPKAFAACTAAYFAQLTKLLPDLNRKAFKLLKGVSAASARQWRDLSVFPTALRGELCALEIPPGSAHIHSLDRRNRLEVILTLRSEHPRDLPKSRIENSARKLLIGSGLFGPNDLFTLRLERSSEEPEQLRIIEPAELDAALEQAKLFLEEKIFLPALRGTQIAQRTLHVVRDTRQWISKFTKIGDLVAYMDRFKPNTQQRLPFLEIKQIGFEDVHAEFVKRFGRFRGFQTTIADFKEGNAYSAFTLSIYTRTFSNRGAGIRPVGRTGTHAAVVVNITLSGDKYANEWLDVGKRLKCYLKAPRGRGESQFAESHGANRSIMNYPNVPILVFTRKPREPAFIYNGIFRYTQISADDDGAKWFDLLKVD